MQKSLDFGTESYNPLFYKTYRIDYSEYYLGKEEVNQLTESESTRK